MCSGDKDLKKQCPTGVFSYNTQAQADAAWNMRSQVTPAPYALMEALNWLRENMASPEIDLQYKMAHLDIARDLAAFVVEMAPPVEPLASAVDTPACDGPCACANAAHMGKFACKDRTQCWEPCGELGKDPASARVSNVEVILERDEPEAVQDAGALAVPAQPMQYTVMAYRWGWTNSSHYLVGATQDVDRAIEMAEAECDDRGGKYGVAVYQWKKEDEYERVFYASSTYREEEPEHNHRIDMFSNVGHHAHDAATTGHVLMSELTDNGEKSGFLEHVKVEFPSWLEQVVRDAENQSFWGSRAARDTKARAKAGQAQLTGDEQKNWFNQIQSDAKVYVDGIFAARDNNKGANV